MEKPHLLSLSLEELEQHIAALKLPKFRAKQIKDWIYEHGVINPDEMTNLPQAFREELKKSFRCDLPKVVSQLTSKDGSTKLLLKDQKGRSIETVILRYENRTSLCVSSQVGCKLACSFCQTGKLGFVSHLPKEDILAQMILANQILKQDSDSERKVSHVVFMGMGEPLDNYDNAVGAANTMISPDYFGLSARHVTISTSGLAKRIEQLATDSRAALAISLHAATDELRTELMPINRKYPLASLKQALLYYQKVTGKKITIEYILIRDTNCSIKEAKALVKFLHGMRCKVNLIPFNAHPGLPYQRPSDDEIRSFQKYLADRSLPAPVRYSKGLEVSAACGQLAAKERSNLFAQPDRKSLVTKPDSSAMSTPC